MGLNLGMTGFSAPSAAAALSLRVLLCLGGGLKVMSSLEAFTWISSIGDPLAVCHQRQRHSRFHLLGWGAALASPVEVCGPVGECGCGVNR